MDVVAVWAAFFGAWMLFAGPLYQAALEMEDEGAEMDQAAIQDALGKVRTTGPSAWWWLIPPVGYVLSRRAARRHWQEVSDLLTPEQLKQAVHFRHKATGWATVALGALLIAVKETAELVEHYHGPVWLWVAAVVVMAFFGAGFTAVSSRRGRERVGDDTNYGRRRRR